MESILSSQKLAKKMQQELGTKQEHLVALYLNTQNQIIHQQTIFIGSTTRSIAEPVRSFTMPSSIWRPL